MKYLNALVPVISVALLQSACQPRQFNKDAEVKHTAGLFKRYANSPMRTNVSAAEYMAYLKVKRPAVLKRGFLNDTNPSLTARLQQWIHAIHTSALTPSEQKTLPEPQLVIPNFMYDDGAAITITNCITVPVNITEARGSSDRSAVAAFRMNPVPRIEVWSAKTEADAPYCFRDHGKNTAILEQLIAHYNSVKSPQDCQISLAAGKIEFGQGCLKNPEGNESPTTTRLLFATAPSIILLSAALIANAGSEDAVAGILAHEMAHYYLLHLVRPVERASYIYKQGDNLSASIEPDNTPESKEIFKTLIALDSKALLKQIPNQKLNRQVIYDTVFNSNFNLADNAVQICDNEKRKCRTDCSELKNILIANDIRKSVMIIKQSLTDTEQKTYLNTEAALLTCAQHSMISADINADSLVMMASMNTRIGDFTKADWQTAKSARNLSEFLTILSNAANRIYNQIENAYTQANSKNLGWYTFEQEADETALELMALVGSQPQSLAAAMKNWMLTDTDRVGSWSTQKCLSALDSGYRNQQGQIEIPPFGFPSDPHHSSCYRAFNIYRELQSHKYQVNTSARPQFTQSWAEAVKQIPPADWKN